MERERGEERATKAACFRRDHEIMNTCEMQTAEYRKQQEQQRCDSCETQHVKIARADF